MMYKELVKGLMEKQREERKDLKATQEKEREATMMNVLADVETIAKELKCEHLLNTKATVEQVVNNVVINKGKVVKVEVEKVVEKIVEKEVKGNTDILKQAIASKDKYIVELEQQLSDKAFNAANNGYVVDGVEVSVQIVNELNKTIKELQEQLANKDAEKDQAVKDMRDKAKAEYTKMKKTASTWQSKYNSLLNEFNKLKANNEQQKAYESQVVENNKPEVKQENKVEKRVENIVKESKQEPKEIKLEKLDVKFKNKFSQAQLFRFNNGFVMGSPAVEELTYLPTPGYVLSDYEKAQINGILVKDYKFGTNRTEMSPYKVYRPNAYFARVNAIKGIETFSKEDTFAGYVIIRNKYYLYTCIAKNSKCYVDDLVKLVAGETITRPSRVVIDEVNKIVFEMYAEYCGILKQNGKDDEENNKQAEELAKKTIEKNAKAAADYKAELEKAKAQFKKGEDKKENTRSRRRQAPSLLSEDSFNSLEKGKAADYADMLI